MKKLANKGGYFRLSNVQQEINFITCSFNGPNFSFKTILPKLDVKHQNILYDILETKYLKIIHTCNQIFEI